MSPQLQHLQARANLLRQVRQHFDARGFFEVQPPCLCRDGVVDPYIDPLSIESSQFKIADSRLSTNYFLQTSPESAMKRMLVAGAPSIYSIGPVFRCGERGPLHNLEFSMLEWYEVGGDAESAIRLLGELAAQLLEASGYDVATYQSAFLDATGIDPLADPLPVVVAHAKTCDRDLAESIREDRDGLLDLIMTEQVGPRLGRKRPLILTDYPISQAALAKPSENDPRCAARFELFVSGIELANGYDELLDPDALLERAKKNNRLRRDSGRSPLSVETTLVVAMRAGLPQCSGVALGLDRLLMLMVGADSIDQVIPFPIETA